MKSSPIQFHETTLSHIKPSNFQPIGVPFDIPIVDGKPRQLQSSPSLLWTFQVLRAKAVAELVKNRKVRDGDDDLDGFEW